ncbi:hypothetical protein G7084_03700 [Weissella coleopterorum]|uniref:WxL domain-containing protein n=1 Tax=Weissella coleopterorum TaxID=2714949 RepID=A0A6G8AZK5_9LACO|nr:WxL domain-containing protein [Weissella coleopterorum]QIL50498.1 hypothetical protein G7084_03700 [Weissella coleopterorum]
MFNLYANRMRALLGTTALVAGLFIAPVFVNAAPLGSASGSTTLSLTSDPTAITLDSVPSFDWGSLTTKEAVSEHGTPGAPALQVTDSRGTDTGYQVTAKASDMKAGAVNLPIVSMTLDTVVNDASLTRATNADIKSGEALVLSGNANTNGTKQTQSTNGKIKIMNNAKVGTYTGTIVYIIQDGALR